MTGQAEHRKRAAMDDRFRTSDADRDRAAALLRDHFAAGRLNAAELDERVAMALNARTFGELHRVLTDLRAAFERDEKVGVRASQRTRRPVKRRGSRSSDLSPTRDLRPNAIQDARPERGLRQPEPELLERCHLRHLHDLRHLQAHKI